MLWRGFFTLGLAVTGAMIFFTCFFLNGLQLITVNQPSLFGQNSNILVAFMGFQTDGLENLDKTCRSKHNLSHRPWANEVWSLCFGHHHLRAWLFACRCFQKFPPQNRISMENPKIIPETVGHWVYHSIFLEARLQDLENLKQT